MCFCVECQIFGRVRLQQTTTTNFDNGTAAVSGIIQFCEYSTWRTVCENNYTDFEADLFCKQFGYTSKYRLLIYFPIKLFLTNAF